MGLEGRVGTASRGAVGEDQGHVKGLTSSGALRSEGGRHRPPLGKED